MKSKTIVRILLLAFALGSLAVWGSKEWAKSKAIAEAAAAPKVEETLPQVEGKQVVMTYFLNDVRCPSCKKIEALTVKTAKEDFAEELASGRLVLRIVNFDEPENDHYIRDYQLTTKSVVISERLNGQEVNWTNMDEVWTLLGEPQKFRAYLAEPIRKHLDS